MFKQNTLTFALLALAMAAPVLAADGNDDTQRENPSTNKENQSEFSSYSECVQALSGEVNNQKAEEVCGKQFQ